MTSPARRPIARPETIIDAALGQKVLLGWMQNRYQTRYPLTLNLAHQSPEHSALVTRTVRGALGCVGAGPDEVQRAATWLAAVGGVLPGDEPADLPVDALRQAQLGAQAYAACAGALGQRTVVVRRFLSFLAARLGIPDEAARSLNRRFAG